MIRQLEEKDWTIVNKWLFEIAKVSFDKVIPSILEKKIIEDYKNFPEGFVVSEERELNGLLWFEANPEKKSAFIHAIYVIPEYRAKGVSDELIEYLEKYCRKRKIESIDLNVTTKLEAAVNFYKRKGFEIKRYQMSKRL